METSSFERSDHRASSKRAAIHAVAVGVDGFPEGSDAVALGSALARATGASLMLVAVHPEPLVVLPPGMDWGSLEQQARAMLGRERESRAPGATIDVETDLSVPRALQRVVRRHHRDLLVVGSSRRAPEGRVRIGKRTRQLLCHFETSLAVAPRGFRSGAEPSFRRIGVGYDGGPEAEAALALAGSIALASGAELLVHAVLDNRLPASWWSSRAAVGMVALWEKAAGEELERLEADARSAAGRTAANVQVQAAMGRPADSLLSVSEEVDLLVIGSRRWGAVDRLLLGSTGEALMHDAACPVLAVPRPAA
jgi:nucleotide-binding universal stress UspA family protein